MKRDLAEYLVRQSGAHIVGVSKGRDGYYLCTNCPGMIIHPADLGCAEAVASERAAARARAL